MVNVKQMNVVETCDRNWRPQGPFCAQVVRLVNDLSPGSERAIDWMPRWCVVCDSGSYDGDGYCVGFYGGAACARTLGYGRRQLLRLLVAGEDVPGVSPYGELAQEAVRRRALQDEIVARRRQEALSAASARTEQQRDEERAMLVMRHALLLASPQFDHRATGPLVIEPREPRGPSTIGSDQPDPELEPPEEARKGPLLQTCRPSSRAFHEWQEVAAQALGAVERVPRDDAAMRQREERHQQRREEREQRREEEREQRREERQQRREENLFSCNLMWRKLFFSCNLLWRRLFFPVISYGGEFSCNLLWRRLFFPVMACGGDSFFLQCPVEEIIFGIVIPFSVISCRGEGSAAARRGQQEEEDR